MPGQWNVYFCEKSAEKSTPDRRLGRTARCLVKAGEVRQAAIPMPKRDDVNFVETAEKMARGAVDARTDCEKLAQGRGRGQTAGAMVELRTDGESPLRGRRRTTSVTVGGNMEIVSSVNHTFTTSIRPDSPVRFRRSLHSYLLTYLLTSEIFALGLRIITVQHGSADTVVRAMNVNQSKKLQQFTKLCKGDNYDLTKLLYKTTKHSRDNSEKFLCISLNIEYALLTIYC